MHSVMGAMLPAGQASPFVSKGDIDSLTFTKGKGGTAPTIVIPCHAVALLRTGRTATEWDVPLSLLCGLVSHIRQPGCFTAWSEISLKMKMPTLSSCPYTAASEISQKMMNVQSELSSARLRCESAPFCQQLSAESFCRSPIVLRASSPRACLDPEHLLAGRAAWSCLTQLQIASHPLTGHRGRVHLRPQGSRPTMLKPCLWPTMMSPPSLWRCRRPMTSCACSSGMWRGS